MRSSRNGADTTAVFIRSTWLDAPIAAVYAFHENPHNLAKISPPWLFLDRVEAEPVACAGGRFRIVARPFGLRIDWTGEWLVVEPPRRLADGPERARLADGAVRAPFAVFDHEHIFETENGGTRMTDRVTYALLGRRWGWIRRGANAFAATLVLGPMFLGRHATTRRFFAPAAARSE